MTILLVPDLGRGHGTGHLRRCIKLLNVLPNSVLLLPDAGSPEVRNRNELGDLLSESAEDRIVEAVPAYSSTVVLDLFHASEDDVLAYGDALTIGLDIGGPGRAYCSYVVDSLPRLDGTPANQSSRGYLDLPDRRPVPVSAAGRMLVSFGGEDPAGLTEQTVRALVETTGVDREKLTVVRPSLRELKEEPSGIRFVGPVQSLHDLIYENEWVICSHGMTAFEAVAAGRRVVTVAPTRYHDRLARIAGFPVAGVRRPSRRLLSRLLKEGPAARKPVHPVPAPERKSLAFLIGGLEAGHRGCPVHPGTRGPVMWRNEEKSYFRCPVCGLVYLERFRGDEEQYGASYFSDEYKVQYGRTYLEDFETIKGMGARRLREIQSLMPGAKTVLDIGCAYGPFLSASRQRGMLPFGVDVSTEAVDYVNRSLKLPAISGSVLDLDPASAFGRSEFDIVTLWYVIEHFDRLDLLLGRILPWVSPGGILAFATPNLCGVSGRRNSDRFFAGSPRDHYSIWSPASARRIMAELGLRVEKIRKTGHHPERYPAVSGGVLPRQVAAVHSRIFGWGDTFEVYAKRTVRSGQGAVSE